METKLALWQPESGEILPNGAKTPVSITNYAQQLSLKDKKQISFAFENGYYEMGMNFLWSKTIFALKQELSNVGVSLIGEMLGKSDVDDDDDIDDILSTKETIRIAEELGVVSSTNTLRLRHTNEIISHFGQLSSTESDCEEIDESEAISSLKACVNAVLIRPEIMVPTKFIDFRAALDSKILSKDDPLTRMLVTSPYFFQKLAISILLSTTKQHVGAQLENSLANLNLLLPLLWGNLRHTERWQIGHTYAELYSEGKVTAVAGVKSALSKVKGFDFVPENLRSDTFLKAAKALINAHEGTNNFYNELSPLKALSKLGTTIPTPALGECITAVLCVKLGNYWGVASNAQELANEILMSLTPDRWQYYLNQVLPSEMRILNKLDNQKPKSRWFYLVEKFEFSDLSIKSKEMKIFISTSNLKNEAKFDKARKKLLQAYYGKTI